MQAAVLKNDKEMIVSEVPIPTFGPGQVLIRVNSTSISNYLSKMSDFLHVLS